MTKVNVEKLIEPHLSKYLIKEVYNIETINARNLLTHTRLDLGFKLVYLEMLKHNVKFAIEIYKINISACNFGKFIEFGNEGKNSFEAFENEYKKIFLDIKKNGFDSSITLIPLSYNHSIINGSHRLASAVFLNQSVDCVKIDAPNEIQDYRFFYGRNVSSNVLDSVVTKFIEYATNVHIAFLWPIGNKNNKKIETIIPNIVYKKKIQLNPNGAHNLLSQIYYGEEWLGSVEDDFKGSKGKLVECFKTFDAFEVVAFQADSLDEVLKLKEKIREVFNVGKHSVHITDTKDEAIRTAKVVFNDNSLHFLNYAKPNKYLSTHKKIDIFKKFIEKNSISLNDVVLDSGIILSAYGLREASDIDYFTVDNSKLKYHDEELEYHDEELEYHDEEKIEMIFNPKYHFYFNDVKFISFNQLYKMKQNRAEVKDKNDCKMMEALIENNKAKEFTSKFKQNVLYTQVKIRQKTINLLKVIGIHSYLKKIIKGQK